MLKAWGAILRGAAKLQNPIDISVMSMGFLTFIGYLCKMERYCQQVYRSLKRSTETICHKHTGC